MRASLLRTRALQSVARFISTGRVGVVGLGQMGRKMTQKFLEDGKHVCAFDANAGTMTEVLGLNQTYASSTLRGATSLSNVLGSDAVVSILPNDAAVAQVSKELLVAHRNLHTNSQLIHVSCSTISPVTSRALEEEYAQQGAVFVAAPVFARPDGLAKRQATWMVSGKSEVGISIATELLQSMGNVVSFGEDVGAANVVKLCGNFLIASSIESIGEAMALADKHGVERKQVMGLLSSTIFDCLIYKGYGQRVADRDHRPGGFSLALGLKDVSLVKEAARQADVPMPFLSVLLDRYTSAKARGRSDFDWSAIGLSIAEDAGIDVSKDVEKNKKDIAEGRTY